MASFDDREKGYEGKFAHDQELEFKAKARRDKLLALWVAPQIGLSGSDAENYAKSLAMTAHEKNHDEILVGKILKDFGAKGVAVTEHRLRKQMNELLGTARAQVMGEAKR